MSSTTTGQLLETRFELLDLLVVEAIVAVVKRPNDYSKMNDVVHKTTLLFVVLIVALFRGPPFCFATLLCSAACFCHLQASRSLVDHPPPETVEWEQFSLLLFSLFSSSKSPACFCPRWTRLTLAKRNLPHLGSFRVSLESKMQYF